MTHPALQKTDCFLQFSVIHELRECANHPTAQVVGKEEKQ